MVNLAHIGLVALLGLGTAGLVTANASGTDLACGVATHVENGMQVLEGTLVSPIAISGDYRLAINSRSGGGSSQINQGGSFVAAADETVSLGRAMVNQGATLDVTLTITANGESFDCSTVYAAQ